MNNAINWFEIPSVDFDRAVQFYSTVLGAPLQKEVFNGVPNGVFPYDNDLVGGAVVFSPDYEPSQKGVLIYINARGDLDGAVGRIEAAGGKVVMPKTFIGDPGYIAIVIDTEGNKVALHQSKE